MIRGAYCAVLRRDGAMVALRISGPDPVEARRLVGEFAAAPACPAGAPLATMLQELVTRHGIPAIMHELVAITRTYGATGLYTRLVQLCRWLDNR